MALRAREFVMKDGYSMHADQECLQQTYDNVCEAYKRILGRLTGGTDSWAAARGAAGAMGGSISHEWHIFSEEGEDQVKQTCAKGVAFSFCVFLFETKNVADLFFRLFFVLILVFCSLQLFGF